MNAERRVLCYIPILHTGADLGGLAAPLAAAAEGRLGGDAWQSHRAQVQRLWDATEKAVLQLNIDYGSLLVYQDGLPVSGREAAIVDELAQAGSRNHQLLQRLRERGATLVGTESPELLVEEYALAKQVLDTGATAGEQTAAQRALAGDLLARRDRFIAKRIADTLPAGRTGLLFIGALHGVAPYLPADVAVSYPIGRP